MDYFLLLFLIYNIVLGIILTVIHMANENKKVKPVTIAWLLLFPTVGLGKWHYAKAIRDGKTIEFSEKWFLWKYMTKVNWGFILLQGVVPVLIMIIASVALLIGINEPFGTGNPVEMALGFLAGMGIMAIVFLVLFVMLLNLGLQYLVLIAFPKYQLRKIEKAKYYELLYAESARKQQGTTGAYPKQESAKCIPLYASLEAYVQSCKNEFDSIPKDRKHLLSELAGYIRGKQLQGEIVNLVFICTHNSRRSHFAQIWAATAAAHYGQRNIHTFSGGTEVTSLHKNVIAALKRVGFAIDGSLGTNPHYSIRFSDEAGSIEGFSKKFDDPFNPQKGFAAIMTCSSADMDCPLVPGAAYRAAVTYDDPKVSDGTMNETTTYDERCRQIAIEMLYLMS